MGGYIATGAGILASRAFHMDDDTNTKKKSSNRANKKLGVVSVCSWHNFEKSFAPNSYLYLRLDREKVLIKDSYVENMISEILISSESEGSILEFAYRRHISKSKLESCFEPSDATISWHRLFSESGWRRAKL